MTQPGSGFGSGSPSGGYGGSGGSSDGPSILGGGPAPVGGGYRSPKKSGGGGLIALIAVAVLLLGGIVALVVFVLSGKGGAIAADPSSLPPKQASAAHKHLPQGCDLVARANLAQMMEVPAVKAHLVPVLEDMKRAGSDPGSTQISTLVGVAGIDADRDIKDVAVCAKGLDQPARSQKVALVIGGDLRPETLVPAVEKVELRKRDKAEVSKLNGRLVARTRASDGDTILLGQAADGAIVVANDEALFAAATGDAAPRDSEYALPLQADGAVTIAASAMRQAVAKGGPNPFLKDVNEITRAVATASLADARIELRFVTTSSRAAKGLADIYGLVLAPMVRQQLASAKGKAPGVDVLMNAKAAVDGADFVLTAQGTAADVEAAVRELARILREEKAGLAL